MKDYYIVHCKARTMEPGVLVQLTKDQILSHTFVLNGLAPTVASLPGEGAFAVGDGGWITIVCKVCKQHLNRIDHVDDFGNDS
jgi:hypothetical protein